MGAACLGGADADAYLGGADEYLYLGGAGRERLLLAGSHIAAEAFALLLAVEAGRLQASV